VFLEGPEDDVRNEGDNDEEEGEEPDPGGGEGVVVHPETSHRQTVGCRRPPASFLWLSPSSPI
jgi:hypothetical protein